MPHFRISTKTLGLILVPLSLIVIYPKFFPIRTTDEKSIAVTNQAQAQSVQSSNVDFKLAESESLGFFDNVSSDHWKLLKKKVKEVSPNYNLAIPPLQIEGKRWDRRNNNGGFFYQNHYEPDFVCPHERRIGKLGDGGKWICDPHRIAKQSSCLVYSVGSNNDFSFELAVQKEISANCEIHTFDFGNYKEGGDKAGVTYHQVGLGADSEGNTKYKSLKTITKELGHEGRTIDIFKIDCEGCEWSTVAAWFEADVTLKQIQVELHNSKIPETAHFFETMYDNNYVVTHKEPNIAYPLKGGYAIEYAFLKLAPEFFDGIERERLPRDDK